jgi:hypothetical protein
MKTIKSTVNNEYETTEPVNSFDRKNLNIFNGVKKIIKPTKNDSDDNADATTSNEVIITKTGLTIYKCINKINNLECKGELKGKGLVLQKGEKCFECQFGNMPKLQTDINLLSPNPSKSPNLSPRGRSYSDPISPTPSTLTQKTDESEVDPFMFTAPKTLKRQGAYIRKKRNFSEGNARIETVQVEQSNPEIVNEEPLNNNGSFYFVLVPENQLERVSSSSSDLVIKDPWKKVCKEIKDKSKSEFEELVEETSQKIIRNELKKVKELSKENRSLKDENELLKQRIAELEEKSAKEAFEIYDMYMKVEIPPIK